MTNKIEYLILCAAIKNYETLKNVASDWQLSHVEVAVAANRLFQKGDILAAFPTDEDKENIRDVILTMPQIQAHLDGKLNAFYYLTPQGGTRWEALSNPDWNLYHKWCFKIDSESEIISTDRKLIEKLLSVSYLHGEIPIPETETWDELEPWQATYWKTLPKAYRVSYQSKNFEYCINSNTPQEWIEANKQAHSWYSKILQWYTEPEFDLNPSSLFNNTTPNYYTIPAETPFPQVEYLILEMAVICNYYSLLSVAYSQHLSHAEIAIAAHALFERGDIRARVFADEYDEEGYPDVVLTMAGIQDHLDGRIRAFYYLTPQGGARWEALSHPDWNKFLIVNFLGTFPYEDGILGTIRENIEKLLALDKFVLSHQHIPGTEVWEVLEPWQATYWKTLPRGYRVGCEYQPNSQDYWNLDEDTPAELVESYKQASLWYENVRKWYTDPWSE